MGGPFFAAAAFAGARAPLKAIEMYTFLKVRSAAAPVPVGRKSLIFSCFAFALENREEDEAFSRSSRMGQHAQCLDMEHAGQYGISSMLARARSAAF